MTHDSHAAAEFLLRGCVQGIGVRPAIARLALELGLHGHVANGAEGVTVHVEGTTLQLTAFEVQLPASLPPGAAVRRVDRRPVAALGSKDFSIETGSSSGPVATTVPLDRAVCEECLLEVADARNRRAGYAFTSCTNCGPRYSIVETMPYERGPTAMGAFAQCPECESEYAAPVDRRFHAQTNACVRCGPRLHASLRSPPADRVETISEPIGGRSRPIGRMKRDSMDAAAGGPLTPALSPIGQSTSVAMSRTGEREASDVTRIRAADTSLIAAAAAVLRRGGIVAIKGLGGFQLLCDATDDAAVRRLRERKRRPAKPLAVMVGPLQLNGITTAELAALQSPAGPIVLVEGESVPDLASQLAPGLDSVGVMRPTTPLHALLLQAVERPLVVTSGNIDGDPLEYAGDAARSALREVADLFLDHDRAIVRPIDDSVVRCIAGQAVTIRAARGLAPLSLDLECPTHILAVGGHQKAAIALSNGLQCILGPHIGDLDSPAARERFVEQTEALRKLYGASPELVVHDLHPDYFTSRWAATLGIPTLAVQHHHAHIAAGMLERGWLDREVLGVAFDGTGLGSDGTIWGGEFLRATATTFERVGSLRPFSLLGGERAISEPWRVALALVADACGVATATQVLATFVDDQRLARVLPVLSRQVHPQTTSLGLLFDGVASLVLGLADSSFEGQPAMMLEAVCDRSVLDRKEFPVREEAGLLRLDWRPVVAALVEDLRRGAAAGSIAMQFHRAMAAGVRFVSERFEELPVVLQGGCFQNRVLTELICEELQQRASPVGPPGRIPPNDGGLAAGQLVIAAAKLDRRTKTSRT